MNNKITITMPYYDQPEMLMEHLKHWDQYPEWAHEYLELIIVDDGSPNASAGDVLDSVGHPRFPFRVFRIQEDIPWNHGGARNLAFDLMEEGWAVLTDIDHVLPLESVCSLLTMILLPDCVYIPARYRKLGLVEREEIDRHSDSFILTREKFWQVGGFDEDFSGYWNGVSGPFRKALKRLSGTIELDHVHFIHYDTDLIPDAHVKLGRRRSEYDILAVKNKELKIKYTKALGSHYSPKNHLRFKWEQVI